MNIYYINLDRDEDRRKRFEAQARDMVLECQRVPAVYAKEMPPEILHNAVNHFRWWCAIGRPIKPGEIGCAISHYKIYQRMIDENLAAACILEDDVVLDRRFVEVFKHVGQWIDTGKSQVVLLSNHTRDTAEDGVVKAARADMYTEGYIITQKAARALLKANRPLQVPCDHWGRWVRQRIIELYHAFPTVCRQENDIESSSISSVNQFKVSDLPVALRMFHKVKRAIGLTIDSFLLMIGR